MLSLPISSLAICGQILKQGCHDLTYLHPTFHFSLFCPQKKTLVPAQALKLILHQDCWEKLHSLTLHLANFA